MSIRYEYIRQNVVINSLIRFGPFSFSGDEFPNNAEGKKLRGDLIIARGALTVVVSRVDKLIEGDKHAGVKTSTYKLLDALLLWFTKHNNACEVLLPLRDYMELCGVSDVQEARRKVNNDLMVMSALSLTYRDTTKNRSKAYDSLRIVESAEIKSGILRVKFTEDFEKMLCKSYLMPYPVELFTIKIDKYPNAPYIVRRIAEHKNMNYGKANENKISVKTLFLSSPVLPIVEEVRTSSNPAIAKRIMRPFLRDLSKSCEVLGIVYSFTYKESVLSETEVCKLRYEIFISDVYVKFQSLWPDYPVRKQKEKQSSR